MNLLSLYLFALGVHAQGKWEFYAYSGLAGMLSYGRLDPIISPGGVSTHVHQIQGGNSFSATFDYDTVQSEGSCSTVEVQEDQSNYWAPALYSYDGTGSFSLMLSTFHVYYQFTTFSYDPNNKNGSAKRYAFPPGFGMLAGNMYFRSSNKSDPRTTANNFQCFLGNGTVVRSRDIRDFQRAGIKCSPLRATTSFPSCWDGSPDNKDQSHAVYPGLGYVCPSTHPYALMSVNFEWYWPTQNFPFDPKRQDNWVFSFGDTSGYGFHGDFINGWNSSLLQSAIDSCNVTENGIEKCPPFQKYTKQQIPPCMPTGLYPNESVGLDGEVLSALPGCNKLWTDNSTKPSCDNVPTPPINLKLGPDLSQWNYVGCPLLWQGKGLILNAKSRKNWPNMTVDSCLAECKGYRYAMMEWGNNCFCDNQILQNGTTVSDPNYACQVRCPGDYLQFCGGYGSGTLYEACEGGACGFKKLYPVIAEPKPTTKSSVGPISILASETKSSGKTSLIESSFRTSIKPSATTSSGSVGARTVTVTLTTTISPSAACR